MNPVYDLGMATKRGLLNTFGKRARALREDLGLRQEDLIREMERRAGVKVGQTYISELERTEKYPTGSLRPVFCSILIPLKSKLVLDIYDIVIYNGCISANTNHPTGATKETNDETLRH